MATDAAAVRAGLYSAVAAPRRRIARLLPRSLVIRPGSTFAEETPVRR